MDSFYRAGLSVVRLGFFILGFVALTTGRDIAGAVLIGATLVCVHIEAFGGSRG